MVVDSVDRTKPAPWQTGHRWAWDSIRLGRNRWRDNSIKPNGEIRPI